MSREMQICVWNMLVSIGELLPNMKISGSKDK